MNQESYRRLISGQDRRLLAATLRFFLRVISWFYSALIVLRNQFYSKGWLRTCRANATVISIGSITAGGTGKTPLVIWLCSLLRQKNIRHAVLTRGYKTKRGRLSDEPAVLAKSCREAKVIVDPDRVAGAASAVNKFGAKAVIMDDGFQHRRLHRDLDIVTIDSMCPFGYDRLLPAGLLREPVIALERADAVVITRCDQTAESELTRLEEKLQSANPNMVIARSIHTPICAKSLEREEISLEELKSRSIFAFCGIGNPNAFLGTIKRIGLNPAGSKVYNDHYRFTENDIADIYEEAIYLGADLILTTQKDWTKIAPLVSIKKDILCAYLVVELRLTAKEEKITRLIEDALAGKIPRD